MLMHGTEGHKHECKRDTLNTLTKENNHTSTWHVSDITAISFSLYLKGNVTYKYTTNVHTLQTRTTLSKSLDVHKY